MPSVEDFFTGPTLLVAASVLYSAVTGTYGIKGTAFRRSLLVIGFILAVAAMYQSAVQTQEAKQQGKDAAEHKKDAEEQKKNAEQKTRQYDMQLQLTQTLEAQNNAQLARMAKVQSDIRDMMTYNSPPSPLPGMKSPTNKTA